MDVESFCGVYEKFHQWGDVDPGTSDKTLAIYEISPSPSSYGMTSGIDWNPCPGGLGKSGRSATFKSTDGQLVAHVSLCHLFQPPKKCLVITIYSLLQDRSDHESHGHGEPPPTGVWIGVSNGGVAGPPVDR